MNTVSTYKILRHILVDSVHVCMGFSIFTMDVCVRVWVHAVMVYTQSDICSISCRTTCVYTDRFEYSNDWKEFHSSFVSYTVRHHLMSVTAFAVWCFTSFFPFKWWFWLLCTQNIYGIYLYLPYILDRNWWCFLRSSIFIEGYHCSLFIARMSHSVKYTP